MSTVAQASLSARIAKTINATEQQVNAAIELLDDGATVPFISRYRKEVTGALTDTQLRDLEEQLGYLRDLEQRRESIIQTIREQGNLSDELNRKLAAVQTKAELEDLYLPYKKKRRTKGQIAIEAGLAPLAEQLWTTPATDPQASAEKYINNGAETDSTLHVKDSTAALLGARYILMERFAEDAILIAKLRTLLQSEAYLCSSMVKGKSDEGAKFSDYFDHQEPLQKIPGHRALAMLRGRSEGVLSLQLLMKHGDEFNDTRCIDTIAAHLEFIDILAIALE